MNTLHCIAKEGLKKTIYKWHPLTYEIDSRIDKRWVLYRSIVSNTGRYCYFRIPKSANSTIVRSLAYYDPDIAYNPADQDGHTYKQTSRSHLLSARAFTVAQLTGKYFLFTFVRNPYARVLSAYLDKIMSPERKEFDVHRKAILLFSDSGCDLTFEGFLRYLENGGLHGDPHWTPQTSMLPVRPSRIHFVGKVESLDCDLRYVVDRIFGEGVYTEPLTRQHMRTYSSDKLLQYYDKELFERVYKLYESDFASFSYPKEWSVNRLG